MAKLSQADKMRIHTLREQGLGAKAIKAAFIFTWNLVPLCQIISSTNSESLKQKYYFLI